jgi:hypothetical protein
MPTHTPEFARVRDALRTDAHSFNNGSFTGATTTVFQTGRVHPKSSNGTLWQVAPWLGVCYLPFWLDYVIIDVDPACEVLIRTVVVNPFRLRPAHDSLHGLLLALDDRDGRVDVHHDARSDRHRQGTGALERDRCQGRLGYECLCAGASSEVGSRWWALGGLLSAHIEAGRCVRWGCYAGGALFKSPAARFDRSKEFRQRASLPSFRGGNKVY